MQGFGHLNFEFVSSFVLRLSILVTATRRAGDSCALAAAIAFAANTFAAASADEVVLETVVLQPMVEADAPARQTGVLGQIVVEEGAQFSKGDLLASLDDRAARLALQKAKLERDLVDAKAKNRLNIEYAVKALEVAQAELQRSEKSIAQFSKSVSQSQIDVERLTVEKLQLERQQAERDLELLQYELRLKENAVEAAQLELELHRIRAPFDGTVVLVRGRLGEWVEPGAPVMRLIAIDRLRAEGFASAGQIHADDVGRHVRFTMTRDGGASVSADGVLRYVSPEMDPVNKQVRVWAEIENAARRLRPGAQGRLVIQDSELSTTQQAAEAP